MEDESKFEHEKLDLEKSMHTLEQAKFDFEKSMRERELALKENEARFGAQLFKMLATMMPLFVALVASYFAYRQFVQTQQNSVDAQARAALYTAATQQYQVVLDAQKNQLKRKDTALDALAENVKTIRNLIDGPDFIKKEAYRTANRQFYVIESSVIPLIKTPDLADAVGLFEKGMVRSQRLVKKSSPSDDYASLNAAWKAFHQRTGIQAPVQDLPQDYADMIGYLATDVAVIVEQRHAANADPDQFGTVKQIFDRTAGTTQTSK